jgi:hypothetical protein
MISTLHPVDLRLLEDRLQAFGLAVIGGDHQLAGLAVRHAVRRAEIVQHPPRARAVVGALRPGRIVQAGMDHLAVARGDAGADAAGGFGDEYLVPGERRRPRHREPDHAGSDHQDLHLAPAQTSTGSPT